MSRSVISVIDYDFGFPRVSGDEPLTSEMETYHLTFSPRERG